MMKSDVWNDENTRQTWGRCFIWFFVSSSRWCLMLTSLTPVVSAGGVSVWRLSGEEQRHRLRGADQHPESQPGKNQNHRTRTTFFGLFSTNVCVKTVNLLVGIHVCFGTRACDSWPPTCRAPALLSRGSVSGGFTHQVSAPPDCQTLKHLYVALSSASSRTLLITSVDTISLKLSSFCSLVFGPFTAAQQGNTRKEDLMCLSQTAEASH